MKPTPLPWQAAAGNSVGHFDMAMSPDGWTSPCFTRAAGATLSPDEIRDYSGLINGIISEIKDANMLKRYTIRNGKQIRNNGVAPVYGIRYIGACLDYIMEIAEYQVRIYGYVKET